MNVAALIAEFFLPMIFMLLPLLIPVIIVSKIFRFKDVIVRLLDEARKNPNLYKNDPEAVRMLMLKLQQNKGGSRTVNIRQEPSRTPGRTTSVPPSSGRSSSGQSQSSRSLRSSSSARRSSPLRGTARMSQIRQEHKIKTTVAVFLLLGGVGMMFSTYYYGFQPEAFMGGAVMMGAGLFLLKSGVERV
ncbi:MAG: hypothetical protein KA099_02335 [Alphaproteobacteria bacterium]|nr:hypothetical protein [Alphaproteobacteria bacterium]MBP7758799.1 hypothetical protein [Alphaproteobacteria bacterium]MBP7762127.1 hypothetical protein [Alphaproteobacteria bacterium]MBP7904140.1 hypothetical protein [Alphaproteobacteria bacterium]